MELYNVKDMMHKRHLLALAISRMRITLPQPVFVLVYITLKCNSNCSWCFQKKDLFYNRDTLQMNPNDFRRILASLKKDFLFKPHIHLFGGEPLSHPEFSKFLTISRELGFCPSITTNIDYLKDNIEILNNSVVKQINISINRQSIIENVENSYNDAVLQIERLQKSRKIINLNYYLNPSEYYLLEKIVMFFNKKLKKGIISTFICQHLFFENNEQAINKNKKIDFKIMGEQIIRLKNKQLNFKLLFFPDIHVDDLRQYYTSDLLFKNECYVPWMGLSVYPELNVTFGGGMLWCNKIIGDLKAQSWRKIWRGKEISNLRNVILTKGLSKECIRCCHKLYY